MIPALTLFWNGLPKWLQDAIKWTGIVLAIILFGKAYVEAQKGAAVRREREKQARRNAEREAEIVNTITENSNELVRESERVRAGDARVELPDGTKGLPPYHYRD